MVAFFMLLTLPGYSRCAVANYQTKYNLKKQPNPLFS